MTALIEVLLVLVVIFLVLHFLRGEKPNKPKGE